MRRLLLSLALAIVAAAVFASSASAGAPSYFPSGPQQSVPVSTVTGGGWTQCFIDTYADDLHAALPGLLSSCSENYLMLAGRPTGSGTLTLLAAAPRSDVLFDTGQNLEVTHTANGSAWYFHNDPAGANAVGDAWGFALAGDAVFKDVCDLEGVDGSDRLCWHLVAGAGGYRLGEEITFENTTERIVYESNGAALPTSKDECKKGGWKDFGETFKNQGQCVKFVNTGR